MPEIYRRRVPNGPDIIGYYLPGLTATLRILVGTGSADEPPGRNCVSHVLSQAVFQRTVHQSESKPAAYLRLRLGGPFNLEG